MRGLQRMGLAALVALLWSMSITPVSAQALRGIRLRVDPAIFQWVKQSAEIPGDPLTGDPRIESSVTRSTFGLFPSVALGLGGAFNNNINLGLNVLLAVQSVHAKTMVDDVTATADTDVLTLGLVPYLEYVFNGDAMRGFISFHAGAGSETVTNSAGETDTGVTATFGASGGLHYFVNEHVSLDPHARLFYSAGSVDKVEVSSTEIAFVLGVSAWIGDSKAETAEAPTANTRGSEGDVWAGPRAQRRPPQAAPDARGNTATTTLNMNGMRIDVMGDVGHPDVIAVRFLRMTPTHRAPTIRCETWTIVEGDRRTEITHAVYKGEPSGPGVQETLKSHVPTTALRALAPSGGAYGQAAARFEVCGERLDISISNRADLISFFRRFDKLLELNGTTATPAATPTETPAAPVTPETIDAAPTAPSATPTAPSTAPSSTAPATTPTTAPATPTAAPAVPTAPSATRTAPAAAPVPAR